MKKYFMNESREELTFGDQLVLDLTEDMKNGHVKHQHLDCKFIPELIPLLLESGVIKEEVIDDEEDDEEEETNGKPLDFVDDDECENCDECPMLCALYGAHQDLSERIAKLQDSMEKMAANMAEMASVLELLTKAVTKQKPKKNGGKQE